MSAVLMAVTLPPCLMFHPCASGPGGRCPYPLIAGRDYDVSDGSELDLTRDKTMLWVVL